ncbi:uncharacterized protein LOC107044932 [Diachasma alloeum]|uniref:uncharacterized protein LOC107044932 n=1 Tax=Diachasma alloeum TaxID=454923 RepID=UPI00073812B6|nr:uncharacterized protein LOC107044932 [Diachasma alloeum]
MQSQVDMDLSKQLAELKKDHEQKLKGKNLHIDEQQTVNVSDGEDDKENNVIENELVKTSAPTISSFNVLRVLISPMKVNNSENLQSEETCRGNTDTQESESSDGKEENSITEQVVDPLEPDLVVVADSHKDIPDAGSILNSEVPVHMEGVIPDPKGYTVDGSAEIPNNAPGIQRAEDGNKEKTEPPKKKRKKEKSGMQKSKKSRADSPTRAQVLEQLRAMQEQIDALKNTSYKPILKMVNSLQVQIGEIKESLKMCHEFSCTQFEQLIAAWKDLKDTRLDALYLSVAEPKETSEEPGTSKEIAKKRKRRKANDGPSKLRRTNKKVCLPRIQISSSSGSGSDTDKNAKGQDTRRPKEPQALSSSNSSRSSSASGSLSSADEEEPKTI